MREFVGRILCAGLGALYVAGAVPLFTFGEAGKQIRAFAEAQVTVIADALGIAPWVALALVGPFAIAGPLALVWLIAGNGINRSLWFLAGIAGYGLGRVVLG